MNSQNSSSRGEDLSTEGTKSYLAFAKELANDNGRIMLEHYKRRKEPQFNDVMLSDIAAGLIDENIRKRVGRMFPTHRVFQKGDRIDATTNFEWICDPIDGAFCFSRGHNISVTSVALTIRGESIIAVVYDPWNNKMFNAVKGEGAYLNDQPIRVNSLELKKQTMINAEWWPAARYDVATKIHELAKEKLIYPIHLGSVIHSACLVAEGVFAGSVFGGFISGKNHEAAAAKLLVEEAGGMFTDLCGNAIGFIGDIRGFIISNGVTQSHLVAKLQGLCTTM